MTTLTMMILRVSGDFNGDESAAFSYRLLLLVEAPVRLERYGYTMRKTGRATSCFAFYTLMRVIVMCTWYIAQPTLRRCVVGFGHIYTEVQVFGVVQAVRVAKQVIFECFDAGESDTRFSAG